MSNPFAELSDVVDNAAAYNAALASVLSDDDPKPIIPDPPATFRKLPGGQEVEVRELTGEHEERLAKARASDNAWRFFQVLLECGTEKVDGEAVNPKVLENMLIGDREYLALLIREATYGPEIEYGPVTCPKCSLEFELTLDIHDIPVRELEGATTFEVPIRNGRAICRLANGTDQRFYLEGQRTDAERNTVLLTRCVLKIIEDAGEEHLIAAFPSLVRNLGVVDRRNLLSEITKRQPGPQYNEATVTHECGNSMAVPVGLPQLFPDL